MLCDYMTFQIRNGIQLNKMISSLVIVESINCLRDQAEPHFKDNKKYIKQHKIQGHV